MLVILRFHKTATHLLMKDRSFTEMNLYNLYGENYFFPQKELFLLQLLNINYEKNISYNGYHNRRNFIWTE
jgi:hypothetical protein